MYLKCVNICCGFEMVCVLSIYSTYMLILKNYNMYLNVCEWYINNDKYETENRLRHDDVVF